MVRKSAAVTAADAPDQGGPESKAARTRTRILDAAAFVLSRKGYGGTRLSDVAEHAGLQAPAIYYHFPSREDLIEEVMWAGVASMRAHVTAVLDELPADLSPLDRIDAAAEAHLRHELEISDYTTAAIRNAGQIPERIRARQVAEENEYGDIWRKLVADAKAEGLLRPELDPRVARMLVLGALNWAAEWWNPRRGSLDVVVRTAQTMIRNGLSPENAEAEAAKPKRRARRATA
ncbi:TetR/AcrR family transcriptional regulator [Nocardia seriolae]|uniref:TetR family transcriptional regulator n=1 Tax=Nocardia seriolae TaxID=37332 RepID=A0A0B8NGC5_9NOCA|nr:TetR/AcrR family transcriptional regulator [Nocardia seriolae]MTJ62780.1 TetR family transcriptional regulator [Nocardia seriolae]MTJ73882.1 TetR family transcriptional regulator [Nocardia seriolae]MTJ87813.1 TetR family transcriptional regulator [Nocardia seriolae]MTK31806.1 TetR family transcriptional regulator [Nocardia seriolae]MTK40714.1 TetR family transcriptional regulator [Nocardia seriolae]